MATHDEIAAVLLKIYTLFVSIGYVKETDMRWAPHSEADLNVDLCRATGLTDKAISLLQKIPWTVGRQRFTPEAPIVEWSYDWSIEVCRMPICAEVYDNLDEGEMEEWGGKLEGHFIPLSFGEPNRGSCLVIDTEQGMKDVSSDNEPAPTGKPRYSKRVVGKPKFRRRDC